MRQSYRWGLGYCVTLTNDLEEEMPLQPCGGHDIITPDGMFAYGFCQAGVSADVSKVPTALHCCTLFIAILNFITAISANTSNSCYAF